MHCSLYKSKIFIGLRCDSTISNMITETIMLLTFVSLSLCFFPLGRTLEPEFFSEMDYAGDIPFIQPPNAGAWEENPDRCFNIPPNSQKQLSSVRANGQCLIIYTGSRCTGLSFKINGIDIPNISALTGNQTYDNFDNVATSIRFCDESEGWTSTNVQLFTGKDYAGEQINYGEICECIRLPPGFSTISSVDNHHNCVKLFSSADCSDSDGQPHYDLLPGRSSISRDLSSTPISGRVASLAPCSIPPGCFNLKAHLFHVEFLEDTGHNALRTASSGQMSMSAKTVFVNNGTGTVTQEYIASKEVRQVIEIEKMTFSRRISRYSVERSQSTGVSLGLSLPIKGPFFVKLGVSLTLGVKTAYDSEKEESQLNSEKYISDTTTEFSVRQSIKVSPCSRYSVDSMITVVEGYPMPYKIFFRLTGFFSGERMNAEQLIQELSTIPEYNYNHTIDEYTVAAYATANVMASFGVDTEIWGEGERIRGCYPY